jgi:putative inorganic carbon (HCO3(-)) transporter
MHATTRSEKHRALGRTPLDLPLLFFVLSAFVGLWAAYDPELGRPLLIILLGSVALYLALTWPHFGESTLRRLAWVLLLVQGGLALYFITQFDHLGYPVKMGFVSRLGRLTSKPFPAWGDFYPHPNSLATFIEGGLPLAAGLWLSARNRGERLLSGLFVLLLGYGLLLSASRGSWVAVATCAGLALGVGGGRWLSPTWRRAGLLALAALVLVAVLGVIVIGPERVPGLSSALTRAEDRFELYVNSLHLLRDYPLMGIGLGETFALVYSKYVLLIPHAFLTYAHNLPLAIWLNQGLLGLLSFGWLLVVFYGGVVRQVRHGQGTAFFWGAVLGLTAMFLHGLTDAPQYAESRWIMPVLYALLGLSVAAAPPLPAGRRAFTPQRIVLAVLPVVALGAAAASLLADDFYTNLGALCQTRADLIASLDDATRQQKLDQASDYYQQALDRNARQPAAHWRLGLMALNDDRFPQAIEHLEIARAAMPGHRGAHKALGYAYLWNGQIEQAQEQLGTLDEVPQELDTWIWWRGEQGQDQLAAYAQELRLRLSEDQ